MHGAFAKNWIISLHACSMISTVTSFVLKSVTNSAGLTLGILTDVGGWFWFLDQRVGGYLPVLYR